MKKRVKVIGQVSVVIAKIIVHEVLVKTSIDGQSQLVVSIKYKINNYCFLLVLEGSWVPHLF
jgi:hypothetical protein